MITEAGKSHNLLSASGRPREVGGVIQSESKGLQTRGADGVRLSPSPKEKTGVPAKPAEQIRSSSAFLFC